MQTRLGFMVLMGCGVLSLLLRTAYATPADDADQPGLDAYMRGDYATALRLWQPLAQQGHSGAQMYLAVMYRDGQGVSEDRAVAAQWFRKAADQGNALAMLELGILYEAGQGSAQELAEAQRWYAKAAEMYPPGAGRDDLIRRQARIAHQLAMAQTPAPALAPSPPAGAPAAQTPYRRALVIGNAAYLDSPLTNPVNDATDIAALLRRLGFDVTLHQNANKDVMERAVEVFAQTAPRGSAGLFFFAGHGAQLDGVNYLIPIGAVFQVPVDVRTRAVSADWILGQMDTSAMDVKLLILDACRNNPLGRSWSRGGSRGLAPIDATKGTFIAYATSPGKTAADGSPGGRNSPYTAHLLRDLAVPGRSIHDVFEAVRAGVLAATRGQQLPWETTALIGKFYFTR